MKRIMSLALVLMMLLNVAVPTVNVFAEDGATVVSQEDNAQTEDAKDTNEDTNEVVTDAQAGEPQTDNGNADQQSGDANVDKTAEETAPANTEGSAEATDETAEEKELTDEEMLEGALLANDPNYTFLDGPVGDDITSKVTVKKVDISTPGGKVFVDGKQQKKEAIEWWEEITFYYEWIITPENMQGVKPNDYFVIPAPSSEYFKGKGTLFEEEYSIKSDNGDIGKFKIDKMGNLIAKLNQSIEGRGEVKKGFFEIHLAQKSDKMSARVNLEETEKAPKGVIVFEFFIPEKKQIGSYPMDDRGDISKSGRRDTYKETQSGLVWSIAANREQQRQFINSGTFVEKNNVWIEDEFALNDAFYIYDRDLEIRPFMYAVDNNGIMSSSVALWNGSITGTVYEANDGESYEDFKNRIKPLMNPYDAAVYPSREQAERDRTALVKFNEQGNQEEIEKIINNQENKLKVLVYLGDLNKSRDYDLEKVLNYKSIKGYIDNLLNSHGTISEERHKLMLQKYTTWDETKTDEENERTGKLKPVLFYEINFMTTHPIQGMVSNSVKLKADNIRDINYVADASSVRADGGASLNDFITISVNKKWLGKQGANDITFKITGDDTEEVVSDPSDPTGKKLTTNPKAPTEYRVVLKAGESIVRISKVQANKEVISKTDPTEKDVVPIVYNIEEEMTEEDKKIYEPISSKRGNIFDITNKNTETVRLTVDKTWAANKFPTDSNGTVFVNIYDSRDTNFEYPVKEAQPVTYDAASEKRTLEVDLPKYHLGDRYDGNVPVEYVVKELENDGVTLLENKPSYDHTAGTQTIKLKNTVNTKIILKKLWVASAGKVNPTATILIKNGAKEVARMETATDKEMTYFLPAFDEGNNPITYTVEEAAIAGYSSHKVESVEDGAKKYTFTNRELHNLQVTKKWKNGNTPVSKPVKVTLYYKNKYNEAFLNEYIDVNTQITAVYTNASGEKAATLDNTDGKVKFTLPADSVDGVLLIKGLPYRDKLGNTLYYSVREDEVEGFLPCIVCDDNKHQVKTLYNLASKTLTLKKAWAVSSDDQKTDVEFILTNNGNAFDYKIADVIKKANPSVTVENNKIKVIVPKATGEKRLTVPAYDLDNEEINYKVEEVQLDGFYAPKYDDTTPNQITVKNISSETVSVKVKKVWRHPQGTPEKSVTIAVRPAQNPEKEVVLPKAGVDGDAKWEHTFEGLPKFDSETGELINYEVEETGKPEGYNVSRSKEGDKHLVINTIEGKVSIPVSKKWFGAIKADSVTVGLFQNNVDTNKRAVLRAKAGDADPKVWTDNVTFADLPQYDASGLPYSYTIKEIKIGDVNVVNNETADYKVTVNNYEIINYNKEKIEVPFIKTWVGKPAAQVIFRLKADDNVTGQSVTLTAADVITATESDEWEGKVSWAGKFTNLPKYSETDGHVIVYTVEEEVVAGYTLVQKGNEFINTNTEKIEVSVEKRWVNSSVESVQIELLADGKKVDGITLKAPWKHTFTDLFKYDQTTGKEIVYTVVEKEVPNFKTTYEGDMKNGLIVVNTYIPPIPPYIPEIPGGDGDKPTPPNPPTTTEEIPGEPTPEGEPNKPTPPTPTTPPTPGTPPTEPSIPEEEIPTDPIPQGNTELPKTDGIPAGMLWLLGLGLAGLGLFFKKEK